MFPAYRLLRSRQMRRALTQILAIHLALVLAVSAQEKVELDVIHKIKTEAFRNPKVMDTMFQLTDVHGPRLTGSPQFKAAGDQPLIGYLLACQSWPFS